MKNVSLKAKILFLSCFMVAMTVTVGFMSYVSTQKTISAFKGVVEEEVPVAFSVNQMMLDFRMARINILQLTAAGITLENRQESLNSIQEAWEKFESDNKNYLALAEGAPQNEKEIYAEFIKEMTKARDIFDKALELYKRKPNDESSPERKEMMKLVAIDLENQGKLIKEATNKFVDLQNSQIKEASEGAFKAAKSGTLVSILVTLIGTLVGLSISYIFSTKLARQMNNIIESISSSSREVASASTQIAKSSEELSQASTEQASSLGETAASLEEITAMISKASESASSTEKSSGESQEKAQEGRRAVDQMLSSIEEISRSNEEIVSQVNNSNQQMAEIVRVIQEIGTKTKVINEIVFQTKLLSFNASVEAARAGEHGKGFAVVAEEVGNLAQMSGNAAKEISEMLDGSISKVENIVKESRTKIESLVDSGKQKVEVGIEVARQCSGVLDEIVSNVTKVSGLSQEISQATKEQSQGVGEINKAMSQLDTVTQQNSATSEQTASAAEQLSAQAVSLKGAVEKLVVAIQGGVSTDITQPARKATPTKKSFFASVHPKKKESKKQVSNVIPMKSPKKPHVTTAIATSETTAPVIETKMVSGESFTPSRDSDGFDE